MKPIQSPAEEDKHAGRNYKAQKEWQSKTEVSREC